MKEENETILQNKIDNDVIQKECVCCGTVFLVFKFAESDNQYCTKSCKEQHSIFNYNLQ